MPLACIIFLYMIHSKNVFSPNEYCFILCIHREIEMTYHKVIEEARFEESQRIQKKLSPRLQAYINRWASKNKK